MRELNPKERLYYYRQEGEVAPLEDACGLIKKINDFLDRHRFQKYYLKHLICTDENVKSSFQVLLNEAEALCAIGTNYVAMYILASLYTYKIGEEYKKKVFELLERGKEAGFPRSCMQLGYCYEHGIGCIKDEKRAYELYRQADSWGSLEAKAEIGRMYYYGIYVSKSYQTAYDYFTASTDGTDNVVPIIGLASMFYNADKQGYSRNIPEAKRLLKLISDKSTIAMTRLGFIEKWYGTIDSSISWYEKAAERADPYAAECLSKIYKGDISATKSVRSYSKERFWKERYEELSRIEKEVKYAVAEDYYLSDYRNHLKKQEKEKPSLFKSCLITLIAGIVIVLLVILGLNVFGDILSFILSLPMRIIGWIFGNG